MAAPRRVVQAVEAAIVASANLAALQHVSAAAEACQRLGRLSSGRWRSAARDLAGLEEDLQTSLSSAAETLASRAEDVGVPEDALWTVGDAAATLDLLRELALESLEGDDAPAARVLRGEVLFGASFVEDPELPDRGTTLLFGWPDPLAPASWPWQANWVVGDAQDEDRSGDTDGSDASDGTDASDSSDAEELDLFEAGELEGDDALSAELADALSCSRDDARAALRATAMALTRASLLAANTDSDEDDDDDS
ncbi:MAG: hypothetical protein JO020_07625 [Chloroflexi bacterium]|nr:hypothetical protein [Chloroflexota bacterium]MBV9894021.1 hypothetical protein [Chloroflexota bacterium]